MWIPRIIIASLVANLLKSIFTSINVSKQRREFVILMILTVLMLGLGTVFYVFMEKWSWIDSLYFCVITLTTVGYGDIVPVTDEGKLFTIFFSLFGIGVLFGFLHYLAKAQQHQVGEVIDDVTGSDT